MRVTLGDGGGDQIPSSHACGGCLITNILQEAWPEDWITEAMVLSPGQAIPFFGGHSRNEGLSYHRARNVEFGSGGLFNWAGRPTQIEASRKTKTNERHPRTPAVGYDIKEWIRGLEGVSNGEPKLNDGMDCRADQQSIHS